MKQKFSVAGMEIEVIDMLNELREIEGRFIGRIIGDAVRDYYQAVIEEAEGA